MTRSKFATVAEDEDGGLHVFKGKKNTEFSFVRMNDEDDDAPLMEEVTFERRALFHLPEPMDSDAFQEFTEARNINDVIDDCLGLDGGDDE